MISRSPTVGQQRGFASHRLSPLLTTRFVNNARLLGLICLLWPIGSQPQNANTLVQGTVVDEITLEGIGGATVLLSGIVQDRVVNVTAKTAKNGRFSFDKVQPSSGYWLIAMHGDQHVRTVYGQRGQNSMGSQIIVTPGQHFTDLRVPMLPTGSISGRIVDKSNKPIPDARVMVMSGDFAQDWRVLKFSNLGVTNRRGEYRIAGLAPGIYYVRVQVQDGARGISSGDSRIRVESSPSTRPIPRSEATSTESEVYTLIYFPGTIQESEAKAVRVAPGAQVAGIDISVAKVHTRRVRGQVFDATGDLHVGSVQVLLYPTPSLRGAPPLRTMYSVGGTFDLRNILPGAYLLVARSVEGAIFFGSKTVDITTHDVLDLKLTVIKSFDAAGKLLVELPRNVTYDRSRVIVTLRPNAPSTSGDLPAPTFIPANASGGFVSAESGVLPTVELPPIRGILNNDALEFRGLTPWTYTIEVVIPSEEIYVSTIQLGKKTIPGDALRLDGPLNEQLEIVLSYPAGRIQGRVVDTEQKPRGSTRVVLMPRGDLADRPDLFQNLRSDNQGRFQFTRLPPGDYRVFAWESMANGLWLDRTILQLLVQKGTEVTLKQGSTEVVTVQSASGWD